MTMAAGFRCDEGIILCADSEITDEISKWVEPKIQAQAWTEEIGFAATGAGDWEYCKMAFEKLLPRLLDAGPTLTATFSVVEAVVQEIFTGPVASYSGYNRPSFDLLVVISTKEMDGPTLIRSANSAVRWGEEFECIGTGSVLANYLASKLYRPPLTLDEGAVLATYLLQQTEKKARGVGEPFLIQAIHRNGISDMSDAKLKQVSDWLRRREKPPVALKRLPKSLCPILKRSVTIESS